MADSSYLRVVAGVVMSATTGKMLLLECSRRVVTNAGFDIGYNADLGYWLVAVGDATSTSNYFVFRGTKQLTVGVAYILTFTYVESSIATIEVEELGVDGETISAESLTITTGIGGTGDGGIAYDAGSYQSADLGAANANNLIANNTGAMATLRGTGWSGGAGSSPFNGKVFYLRVERQLAGVADAEFLFNETNVNTAPVDATGHCTATLGANVPAIHQAELTVTESGSALADGENYSIGANTSATITIENTGDQLAWLEGLTDSGGSLVYSGSLAFPRWIYPGATVDVPFSQPSPGGTGGAAIEAYPDDWASDALSDGIFNIQLISSSGADSSFRLNHRPWRGPP